jgi:DNA-binding beta-propeller fold protein YncE
MRQIAHLALAILLTGCSVHGTTAPLISSNRIPSQFAGTNGFNSLTLTARSVVNKGWISKEVTPGAKLLYVSSYPACGGCVLIFKQRTGALVGLLSGGPLVQTGGIATDSAGNLYVTNDNPGQNAVWIYPQGSLFPSNSLYDPEVPSNVIVRDDGKVYVSNGGPTASVMVYASGSMDPTSELLDASAIQGFGIALDNTGNVYWGISTASGYQIDKFARGSRKPVNLGIALTDVPQSIAFDQENRLVVAQPNVPTIEIFKLPNTLIAQFGQTGAPFGIGFKSSDSVFVADRIANQVEQYEYPGGNLIKSFAAPNLNPVGVAVFPHK